MSDKTRPNAKYALSRENSGNISDEDLNFHYNRERRLEKAPAIVKDLYAEPRKKSGFNLLRPLIADKARASIFFVIVLMCILILAFSILGFFGRSYTLEGNKIEISSVAYEGTAIIVLKKTAVNDSSAYTGGVNIAVFPVVQDGNEDYFTFYHQVFFTYNKVEEYRFVVPYDSGKLAMVFQTEKNELKMVFTPD